MNKDNLKNNLLLRVNAKVSNMESVKDLNSLVKIAITQANELIKGVSVNEVVREDIAYYRLLLMLDQNDIEESEHKRYDENLQIVKKAKIKEQKSKEKKSSFIKVTTRKVF